MLNFEKKVDESMVELGGWVGGRGHGKQPMKRYEI